MLILADALAATQTISFQRPLLPLATEGHARIEVIDEAELAKGGSKRIEQLWQDLEPTALILSRYAGGLEKTAVTFAHRAGVPVIYHIDDNLFAVPQDLGPKKFARYNNTKRIAALTEAIRSADLIYASTPELARHLRERLPRKRVVAGEIYCVHRKWVPGPQVQAPPVTIGYMGSSGHGRDLELAVPAMERILERHLNLRFETFGTIEMPQALMRFQTRIRHHPGHTDYDAFMRRLSELGWHIGLAPLIDSPFNRCKADTKWVEYTATGIAVVASDLPVYERACADGAGTLVSPHDWEPALERLIQKESLRRELIVKAQVRLTQFYTPERLTRQVLDVLSLPRGSWMSRAWGAATRRLRQMGDRQRLNQVGLT